jgi:Ca2+-binding EF-hand superfamily protein
MAAQPQTTPAPTDPAAPAPNAQAAPAAPADPATAAAQPAPANGGDQVAAVVGKEFPTYDKDANGSLSKTEFTAWMLALKSASDPSVKAEDPKTKTWMTQAFTQADTDKSKSVSKDELTNFLSQASGSKAS